MTWIHLLFGLSVNVSWFFEEFSIRPWEKKRSQIDSHAIRCIQRPQFDFVQRVRGASLRETVASSEHRDARIPIQRCQTLKKIQRTAALVGRLQENRATGRAASRAAPRLSFFLRTAKTSRPGTQVWEGHCTCLLLCSFVRGSMHDRPPDSWMKSHKQ